MRFTLMFGANHWLMLFCVYILKDTINLSYNGNGKSTMVQICLNQPAITKY